MHDPCYQFWKQEDGNNRGECCCNCNFQRPINAHPWNKYTGKGSVMEIIGYGCTHPEFWPSITFFEKEHGMCEVWTKREWPDPTKEQTWNIISR